jgi:Na+-transporting methylmalonyl-CoA/oxaloacetate decarboxylase gamma subunit
MFTFVFFFLALFLILVLETMSMYRDRHDIMLKQTALLEEIRDTIQTEVPTENTPLA